MRAWVVYSKTHTIRLYVLLSSVNQIRFYAHKKHSKPGTKYRFDSVVKLYSLGALGLQKVIISPMCAIGIK